MPEQKKRLTTPAGVAKFVHLSVPNTKFKKEGEYRVMLILPKSADATQKFVAELNEALKEGIEEVKADLKPAKKASLTIRKPYRDEVDPETGAATGNVEIQFKTAATYTTKDGETVQKTIPLFDAKGKRIERKVNVGRGSKIKVNASCATYYMPSDNSAGLTLYLNAVQILDLKTWGGDSAADFGFSEEEGFEDAPPPADTDVADADF